MTEKLFMIDQYVKEFEATVVAINVNQIILNNTAFYAESGGQVGDTGFLNQTKVINTKYDEKNEKKENIIHIIEGAPDFKPGDKIIGKIDWDRRYRIMKNHAASHIMEYFLYKTFGRLKLVGTTVSEKHDSSTYERPEPFGHEEFKEIEKLSNEFISKGCEIERWEDPEMPGWWYWKAGIIKMPCGGTHPKNVKEIGQISIKRKSGGKGREKVLTSIIG